MGIGVFAPFKPASTADDVWRSHPRSYVRVNATWKPGPKTRTEDYWVLIQTPSQSAELVKVLVRLTSEKRCAGSNGMRGLMSLTLLTVPSPAVGLLSRLTGI
jgi:hypothetical protein